MTLEPLFSAAARSHPVRGAWIEIRNGVAVGDLKGRRTPSGVRGLKFLTSCSAFSFRPRRTPSGVRGLKCKNPDQASISPRRTPSGVRGLKFSIAI